MLSRKKWKRLFSFYHLKNPKQLVYAGGTRKEEEEKKKKEEEKENKGRDRGIEED